MIARSRGKVMAGVLGLSLGTLAIGIGLQQKINHTSSMTKNDKPESDDKAQLTCTFNCSEHPATNRKTEESESADSKSASSEVSTWSAESYWGAAEFLFATAPISPIKFVPQIPLDPELPWPTTLYDSPSQRRLTIGADLIMP